MTTTSNMPAPLLRKVVKLAGICGLALAVPVLFEWVRDPAQFYRSYLVAFLFVLAPAVGALAWIMLHRLTGGHWGSFIGEALGAAAATLPYVALLSIPMLIGLEYIYPWAKADWRMDDVTTAHQTILLQRPFFTARAVFYLVLWSVLGWLALRRSVAGSFLARHRVGLGALGLILYFLTATAASIDWGMSLTPRWYSSVYGLIWVFGQGLAALSVALLLQLLVAQERQREAPQDDLRDVANLMFAMVMTWAYLDFSQLLIIWSANLPNEVTWYVSRHSGGWRTLGVFLLVVHFGLPTILLLMRRFKRSAGGLAAICGIVLVCRLPDLLWLIVPSFGSSASRAHWLDIVLPLCLFALWVWFTLRNQERRMARGEELRPLVTENAS